MNILLFTLEYPPFKGGAANYYGNIVKYWSSRKEIAVLSNNNGQLISNRLPFLKWLPAVRELFKVIKKEPISHILVGHILPLGAAALIAKKIKGVNYSIILHGMDLSLALKAGRKKWLAKKILKNASHIICASSFTAGMAREAIGGKGEEKVSVVNPGADILATHNSQLITRLKNKYNLENKIILFSLGRLVRRKGFDKVIEAMPAILKEVPNLVYAIAGTGPDEEYLKVIAGSGSTDVVETRHCLVSTNVDAPLIKGDRGILFLGKITDEEKWAWLELCDIFTMPSRQIGNDFEGFGIVYLEAGLAGKPIMAGRSGGVEDAVLNSETGLLVNSESVKEIANAIIKLAKDEVLRNKLGEAGKKRAQEEFNWENQANKIYQIIKKPSLLKGV
jgi:phosphatidylinositol alpha-1,6-mannosyltransferase